MQPIQVAEAAEKGGLASGHWARRCRERSIRWDQVISWEGIARYRGRSPDPDRIRTPFGTRIAALFTPHTGRDTALCVTACRDWE